uniref:Predicted protein n=1 Tax=Hordeum vulgare subsp. vulgare TaxID=112509 RepID=F2EAJ1_HORVV|nr:predicted protein [Hordeum vulgare subsp. vulgare]
MSCCVAAPTTMVELSALQHRWVDERRITSPTHRLAATSPCMFRRKSAPSVAPRGCSITTVARGTPTCETWAAGVEAWASMLGRTELGEQIHGEMCGDEKGSIWME